MHDEDQGMYGRYMSEILEREGDGEFALGIERREVFGSFILSLWMLNFSFKISQTFRLE